MVTEDGRRWTPGLHGLPTRNGKLKDISHFDAQFFSVHAKQANKMDPQLRILLELTYEALIDAGNYYKELTIVLAMNLEKPAYFVPLPVYKVWFPPHLPHNPVLTQTSWNRIINMISQVLLGLVLQVSAPTM